MSETITPAGRTPRWMLCSLLIVALGLRLGWVLSRPTGDADLARLPDQIEYLELGRNLASGQGLKFFDASFQDEVYAYRMPGYPLLIAACKGNVRAVRVVQALIDTSTVLAAYVLGRRWLGRSASLFAAALVGFNPFLIFFCALILSETLFASMLTWGMALIVKTNPPLKRWASAAWWSGAIILALSVMVRPSAIVLPIILGIASALTNRRSSQAYPPRWSPPVATTILVLSALVLLPWGYRNYRVLGSWVFTTTNSGMTLYDGFNPDATGASDQSFIRSLPQIRAMNELARSEYLSQQASQYIRSHPRRTAQLTAIKIARTWSPVPLSEDYGNRRNVIIALAYMIPFYLLILLGLWLAQAPWSAKVFLVLPAIYFTLVHAGSVGSLRYRIPSDVPMAIVAAMSVSRISGVGLKRAGLEPD